MKTTCKAFVLSVLVMALASCSTFAPKPTQTPTPTETSLPTSTNTPEPTNTPTQTPEPTNTPTKTPVPPTEKPSAGILATPSGKPASEWEGFPIMPNAIAGEGDSTGYSFTINATAHEIQAYYEIELNKLGWKLFGSGQGDTGAVLLIFMKGTSMLSMSVIPQPDDIMYVMIVK